MSDEQSPKPQFVKLYDNSRISAFRRCMRYFYFAHVRDWAPDRKRMPLIFGSSWHEGMDVIWRRHAEAASNPNDVADEAYAAFLTEWQHGGMDHPDNISPDELESLGARTPQVAHEMFYNYIDARKVFFTDPSFEVIDIERPFAVPLDPNDATLFYVGRLDKVFRFRNKIHIGEHKTTTAYRKDGYFRAEFVDSFSPNSQIDGYLFAARLMFGKDMAGVWVDASLVHKIHHDAFKFIPVERQFAQIDAWLWETHTWIDNIEGNLEVLEERSKLDTPYLAAFPKNTGACTDFGGCPYADICRAVPNPAKLDEPPLGYKHEHWSPFNEIKLEKLGFSISRNGEVLKG